MGLASKLAAAQGGAPPGGGGAAAYPGGQQGYPPPAGAQQKPGGAYVSPMTPKRPACALRTPADVSFLDSPASNPIKHTLVPK
ncbi:hypothetical protein CAC42_2503 [Sphaceloma murrayae]|uniref:Uncharacterized protein n=1 Tax=Sphaceloma murrayae TaxID=2082308 RepID=A0A2K1QW95_9PEZI|nr:hypothetical protein CAC42_2503 [Sphaceloma murrayae]